MTYVVLKDITKKECPWLTDTVKAGTIVTEAVDAYGCCTNAETPCNIPGREGYIGLPTNMLERYFDKNLN